MPQYAHIYCQNHHINFSQPIINPTQTKVYFFTLKIYVLYVNVVGTCPYALKWKFLVSKMLNLLNLKLDFLHLKRFFKTFKYDFFHLNCLTLSNTSREVLEHFYHPKKIFYTSTKFLKHSNHSFRSPSCQMRYTLLKKNFNTNAFQIM